MKFRLKMPGGDRRHYIDEADVEVVLSRLPADLTTRIRAIYFDDEARGNRTLGYTTKKGRREIALCALPPHVSLNPFIAGPETALMFGAVKGAQWPPLAVRRFMLYDVLLHEIGHLQVVHERAKNPRRKFAHEIVAQQLANQWRETLWSKPFDHPDPVHNPPSREEISELAGWAEAHAEYKQGVGLRRNAARPHLERAVELFPSHPLALTRLASFLVSSASEGSESDPDDAHRRAVELLGRALRSDPTAFNANFCMGLSLGHLGHYEEARRHIARALRHGLVSATGYSRLAKAYTKWGFPAEAERFARAITESA